MARHYRIAEKGIIPHFVTWSVVEWLPVFVSQRYCQFIADSFQYCRQEKGLLVHAYVIMPTHLHAILSTNQANDLSMVLRDSRRFTAKEIVKALTAEGRGLFEWVFRDAARKARRDEGTHKVWQDGVHPEALASGDFLLQKLQYLHENPVRKGLVERAEQWRYSSAGFYILQEQGPLEIDPFEW